MINVFNGNFKILEGVLQILLVILSILVIVIIAFILSGIFVYRHNMKKDKYDLLQFFVENKNILSCTVVENGQLSFTLNANKKMPLASTVKLVIAYNLVRKVNLNVLDMDLKVKLQDINKFYIKGTDGNAHVNWLKSLSSASQVTITEIAEGMMQYSSNACTDYIIDLIGLGFINQSLKELELKHDEIVYFTPTVLIPGILSENKREAYRMLKAMSQKEFNQLSCQIFEKMRKDQFMNLKINVPQMLDEKMQALLTDKLSHSTTDQYAKMLYKFNNTLFSEQENNLFTSLVLGQKFLKSKKECFWYKGGATLFVVTGAFYYYAEENRKISAALFINDHNAENTYWIKNIFNNFLIAFAREPAFRKEVLRSLKER